MDWLVDHFRLTMLVIWSATVVCSTIALIIVFSNSQQKVATLLDLSVLPFNAKVVIDGEEVGSGIHELLPGKKHIVISADGFANKTFDIDVEKDKTTSFSTYLIHEKKGLTYYANDRSAIDFLRTIKDDDAASNLVAQFDHKNSLFLKLPISTGFSQERGYISAEIKDGRYEQGCKTPFCLIIKRVPSSASVIPGLVSGYLRSIGFNMNDYEVFYENF